MTTAKKKFKYRAIVENKFKALPCLTRDLIGGLHTYDIKTYFSPRQHSKSDDFIAFPVDTLVFNLANILYEKI